MPAPRVPFLDASLDDITAALAAALATVAPGAVVRVGGERDGLRNVGVDVDVPRVARGQSRGIYLDRVHRALEAAGVILAPHALAPSVAGHVRGSVRTAAPAPSSSLPFADAQHLMPAKHHPFRAEAARDLLGLVRLLFVMTDEIPADIERTGEILDIGRALAHAVRAEHQGRVLEAVDRLDALGGWRDGLASIVKIAVDRARGGEREAQRTEREAKRLDRERRG